MNDQRLLDYDLELQSCFPRRVRQGLDTPVIDVSAAIEYDFADSLLLGQFRDLLANALGRSHVAAGDALALFALGG
jgi:hypothetical protein